MLLSRFRWFVWVVAVLALLGCAAPANDTDKVPLAVRQAWRMDASGQDTLQTVQQATDWQALEGWKSWGFGPETIWVRVDLAAASAPADTPWVVRVRPPFLDHVTLYDPVTGRVLRSGDAVPPDDDTLASINLTFVLPALSQERSVYLRVRSASARALQVDVLPLQLANFKNRLHEWAVGFVVATSFVFAVWAAVGWWSTRERLLGVFAFKQSFAVLWGFFVLGFARVSVGPALPAGVLTAVSSTVFMWLLAVTLWFLTCLVSSYQPPRVAVRTLRAMAGVFALMPLLQLVDMTGFMLELGNALIPLSFVLLGLALLTARTRRASAALPWHVVLVYLVVYSTLNSLPPLIHLGWMEGHTVVLFGSLAHAVLDGLVMFAMLQMRARTLERKHQKALQRLEHRRLKAAVDKCYRDEQSQLFSMLAHEVKTPLATLRMWMATGRFERANLEQVITDMSQVIERCVHAGQLAEQGLKPQVQPVDPVALTWSCVRTCRAPARVDVAAPESPQRMDTDAQMLSIVLGNLLDNACKYGAPDARVAVRLCAAARAGRPGWCWEVVNAIGPVCLPDADQMFNKYYRSAQARRLSGSGLGLFLVKGLLALLQGAVHYEAQRERVVFSLWLPFELGEHGAGPGQPAAAGGAQPGKTNRWRQHA